MYYNRIFAYLRLSGAPASILLLGPRQAGKSTLIAHEFQLSKELWLRTPHRAQTLMLYNLMLEDEFLRLTTQPSIFRKEILYAFSQRKSDLPFTVIVDEIQRVPALFNECQVLLDSLNEETQDRGKIRFILTGSSTRKLKRGGANLLPGRIVVKHLYPLTLREIAPVASDGEGSFIQEALIFGTLPGILSIQNWKDRGAVLKSYVTTYIKEEIQAEALVRNLGGFHRFLTIAALYSGQILNISSISRDSGIPIATVRKYFEILEDTFLATSIPCYYQKKELKKVYSHPKFYFFDVGVRNALLERALVSGGLEPEKGLLLEHVVALELIKYKIYLEQDFQLFYFRTYSGLEVDFVLETQERIILIEVKAKKNVSDQDTSALRRADPYLPANKEKLKFLFCLMETPTYCEEDAIEVCSVMNGLNKVYGLLESTK